MTLLDKISQLSPTQFENFVYDCLRASGMANLVWRTPGSDGGRDIEGQVTTTDLVGVEKTEKWYIECKRVKNSIDWPTVWKKLSYADNQDTDVFLLATNSNPSPHCEEEISTWNSSNRRPAIRVWRGYSFEEIVATKPQIRIIHGLETSDAPIGNHVLSLSRLILGIAQSANSRAIFGSDFSIALEAAAILAELLEQRLSDYSLYGEFRRSCPLASPPAYEWLEVDGEYSQIEDIAFNAVVISLFYFSGATAMAVSVEDKTLEFQLVDPRQVPNQFSNAVTVVLEWACAEINSEVDGSTKGKVQFRN